MLGVVLIPNGSSTKRCRTLLSWHWRSSGGRWEIDNWDKRWQRLWRKFRKKMVKGLYDGAELGLNYWIVLEDSWGAHLLKQKSPSGFRSLKSRGIVFFLALLSMSWHRVLGWNPLTQESGAWWNCHHLSLLLSCIHVCSASQQSNVSSWWFQS